MTTFAVGAALAAATGGAGVGPASPLPVASSLAAAAAAALSSSCIADSILHTSMGHWNEAFAAGHTPMRSVGCMSRARHMWMMYVYSLEQDYTACVHYTQSNMLMHNAESVDT